MSPSATSSKAHISTESKMHTERQSDKPAGDWTPHLAQISLPWQQGSAAQHCEWLHWIGHTQKPPDRPKHLQSICHTSRLIGTFVEIWGSKFWALGGLNQKSKNNVLYSATWRTDRQKMARFHRETKKKNQFEGVWQINRQTLGQTDRSQLLTIIDS